MRSISRLFIGLSFFLPLTLGTSDVPLARRALVKRKGTVSYDENCDQPPPANSGYKPSNGFPTRKSVVEKAYADAVTLATGSADIAADSKAFIHYFGGEKPDVQHEHFKGMVSAIKADTDNYFTIKFECSGNAKGCSKTSVAYTDATAGGKGDEKVINICRSFWTSSSTKYLLYDEDKGDNPDVPYLDKSEDGWCGKDGDDLSKKKANEFTTAGHSILHELTHLDSLAEQAGLDAPGGNGENKDRHGTEDVQKGSELIGARAWLQDYKKNSKLTSPDYNAESYAAAATELYFMNLCDFKEIAPKVDEETSTAKPPKPTSSHDPKPPPPYATGTCCFHFIETETCGSDSSNLWGHVKLTDGKKNLLGETKSELGEPMNAGQSYSFKSKLKNPLVITGEHQGDYVQFNVNGIDWKSDEPHDGAHCDVGGWDPKEGPTCGYSRVPIVQPSKRQMDCCFPCDGTT